MHVHPDIAALRSDRLAQRRIRTAMSGASASWQESERCAALSVDLARFGAGEHLEACPDLYRVMSQHGEAMAVVDDWLATMLEVLREEPLGEVPYRYRCSAGLSSVQLLRSGRAALNLVAYESLEEASKPETALISDRESAELVLAGRAEGTLHRRNRPNGSIHTNAARWTEGDRIDLAGPDEARQIVSVDGRLLLLQLTREPQRPGSSQEFRLSDGALLQSASGDKAASQRVMALAVLGALEHGPAIEAIEARALDRSEDPDVRWEAVRQTLALDAGTGIRLLARLQAYEGDELSGAATSLLLQLTRSYPELSKEAA